MPDASARRGELRRRILRMVRRAESRPERGATLVCNEVGEILGDLRRLGSREPSSAAQTLMMLLEHLARIASLVEDDQGHVGTQIEAVLSCLTSMVVRDRQRSRPGVEIREVIDPLFDLWVRDEEGIFRGVEGRLLEMASGSGAQERLMTLCRGELKRLPLAFPFRRGERQDIDRLVLLSERHRLERLLGEVLALRGVTEFAVIVGRDHFRRTGDALDLVRALDRSGNTSEAILLARKALASPRTYQRPRLRELLETLLSDPGESRDRETRRTLEDELVSNPDLKTFRALKQVVPEEQWKRVKQRVLGHLHKHQKAPSLLFQLYMEEGDLLEADGLVVTQDVNADVLAEGARRVRADHPRIAASWLIGAAHRRSTHGRTSAYERAVEDLLQARELATANEQLDSFHRALRQFRARFARRTRLMEQLEKAGL